MANPVDEEDGFVSDDDQVDDHGDGRGFSGDDESGEGGGLSAMKAKRNHQARGN